MIEISNLTRSSFNQKSFQEIAKKILKRERIKGKVEISLVLVGEKRIQGLNKHFRGINKPTNVLAFPEKDFFQKKGVNKAPRFVLPPANLLKLGEIVICPAVIIKEAKQKKQSFQKELLLVFVHGLLHLLGYRHQDKKEARVMGEKQEGYLLLVKKIK